jgi:hypothetical protein
MRTAGRLFLILGALGAPLGAQAVRRIDPQVPVRVWTHAYGTPQLFTGRVVAQDSSTLHVLTSGALLMVMPLAAIDSLQVRRTIRPSKAGRYATLGALFGGTVCGLAAYSSADRDGWQTLAAARGTVVGLLAGALVGGVAGALRERKGWLTLHPPIRLAPSSDGPAGNRQGARIGAAVR